MPILSQMSDQITAKMKELGFAYITLDAEGFRSGAWMYYREITDKKYKRQRV